MEQQFKPIEDFIFVSPAPCYTAAALSNAYRKMALTEKDRYLNLIQNLILIWTISIKHTPFLFGKLLWVIRKHKRACATCSHTVVGKGGITSKTEVSQMPSALEVNLFQ